MHSVSLKFLVGILSFSDYYPFGMQMVGRNDPGDGYRYGFNGMERDDEVKGSGNSYDFGARMYDSRLGRWLKIDNFAGQYRSLSPYNFANNNPIIYIDPDGNAIRIGGQKAKSDFREIVVSFSIKDGDEVKLTGEALFGLTMDEYGNYRSSHTYSVKKFRKRVAKDLGLAVGDERVTQAVDVYKLLQDGETHEFLAVGEDLKDGGIDKMTSIDMYANASDVGLALLVPPESRATSGSTGSNDDIRGNFNSPENKIQKVNEDSGFILGGKRSNEPDAIAYSGTVVYISGSNLLKNIQDYTIDMNDASIDTFIENNKDSNKGKSVNYYDGSKGN
jgi:RHS repeat-associated protein